MTTEKTLYNGSVQVRFNDTTHVYMVKVGDGPWKRRKSVTGITGKAIDKSDQISGWKLEIAAKTLFNVLHSGGPITEEDIVLSVYAADKEKDKAAELGTKIHAWCEGYINYKLGNGPIPDMPEDDMVAKGATSFLEWEADHHVEFLWTEKFLYSKALDFCGTADFAAIVDGRRALGDLKSGNGLYPGVFMQTAGYAIADEEENGEKYDCRWAVRVAKETEEEYYERIKLRNKIKMFLGEKVYPPKPYKVFEAIMLSNDEVGYHRDRDAFIKALQVGDWVRRVDAILKP